MAPVEDESANRSQILPVRRRQTVRLLRLHLHHTQRKSLAKCAVFLTALVLLLALWYVIATRPVSQ
jgi:type II secretory pathway component PulM